MSATVWVVELGTYSDYRVVGVYSAKAHAERVAAILNADDSYEQASVDEWPLDPSIAEIRAGQKLFVIHMNRDGDTRRVERHTHSVEASGFNFLMRDGWNVGVFWGDDAEHAVKVANEFRTRLLASGEWK